MTQASKARIADTKNVSDQVVSSLRHDDYKINFNLLSSSLWSVTYYIQRRIVSAENYM